ncbi:chemotaxis protein CheB [Roseobacter sp. HKCCA0434]|uniref:chemotaxis protein CheB n=1 Tax=Roseobacter sp. HKCCA0434 TaxID=3079297 RepID=UPI002905E554|nr:chemotaxis protein CheB [Roseobacter sp. HKCCA0434]
MAEGDGIRCPVVGIGASAGGLPALVDLFGALSPPTGAAFVVVQHLAPGGAAALIRQLARETTLPVLAARDGAVLRPDHVYVAPDRCDLGLVGDRLRVLPVAADRVGPVPSIDGFFRALARARGEMATGVVLSGTGSDGAGGLDAIGRGGGRVFVQDAHSARFDAMPAAARAVSGLADGLSAVAIGRHLSSAAEPEAEFDLPREMLVQLGALMQARTGAELAQYKPTTLRRRIARRMAIVGDVRPSDYMQRLRTDPAEAPALLSELAITVTSFFRDPEAFARFGRVLAARLRPDRTLRVWVPACATGEEAWSLAMLLAEADGGAFEILATDMDAEALAVAERGVYVAKDCAGLPAERAARHAVSVEGGGIRIGEPLRAHVRFAAHVLGDPAPGDGFDAVSCRNVLIYFNGALQARVLSQIHAALVPEGLLFLGMAETTATAGTLFARLEGRGPVHVAVAPGDRHAAERFAALQEQFGEAILLATPGGETREIGDAARAPLGLMPRAMEPGQPVLTGPLAEDVRNIVRGTFASGARQESGPLTRPDGGGAVRLIAEPLGEGEGVVVRVAPTDAGPAAADATLAAMNAELLAANQDLQATNSALELANEELQSTNEELITVNEQQQVSATQLVRALRELDTVLSVLEAPVLTLDARLDVLRASPAGRRLFGVPDGGGRIHLSRCALPEGAPDATQLTEEVLRPGAARDFTVTVADGARILRATPFRDARRLVVGVVLSLH